MCIVKSVEYHSSAQSFMIAGIQSCTIARPNNWQDLFPIVSPKSLKQQKHHLSVTTGERERACHVSSSQKGAQIHGSGIVAAFWLTSHWAIQAGGLKFTHEARGNFHVHSEPRDPIFLSRKPPNNPNGDRFLKRTMAEKNGQGINP